jgi:hypothetical protein
MRLFRTFTPLGWLVAGVALLMAIGLLVWGWNNLWAWLPWSGEARLDRAEDRADYAEADASARRLESQGNAAQVARTEAYGDLRIRIEGERAAAVTEARSAPDATEPLAADRAARLHAADRGVCNLAAASCATPAEAP